MNIPQDKLDKLDSANVYGSIAKLPDQIEQAVEEVARLSYPDVYKACREIMISGMGGSIFSYYVVRALFRNDLSVPLTKVNDYRIPDRTGPETLFITSSYSGGTEETVTATKEALQKKANVTAVISGGGLERLMRENGLVYYHFDPVNNPSGQPRIGLGYMLFGVIGILSKFGYVDLNGDEIMKALATLRRDDKKIQEEALQITEQLKGKIVLLICAEHLAGVVHICRNQLNETAKTLAQYHLIPELNHHLMEGLQYPQNKQLVCLVYTSSHYKPENQKRVQITVDILKKQRLETVLLSQSGSTPLEEFLLYLQFGSYLSLFLALENNVNPSLIPWVDYFKKKMA